MRNTKQFRNLTLLAFMVVATAFLPFNAVQAQSTPILDVHPDTLYFYADLCGGSPMPGDTIFRTFMVHNSGGGSMNWTGSAGESWVVFDPEHGSDFDSVYTWIDWDIAPVVFTPPLPGDTLFFETEITIEAPGAEDSPQQVIVQLGYTCDPDEHQLLAYPSYFELTAPPDDTLSRHIFVVEAHNANIDFYLSNSSNWLILPEFFAPLVTPDSVEFMVSTIGLDPGIYYDTIVATSSDNLDIRTAVPVILNVSGDGYVLASIPESFSFTVPEGVPILGESLYVYEEHGHSINFWTHNEAYWLYVDTMDASPLYTPRLLTVDIYADTLAPGIYTDTILIYADEFTDSPLLVPVSVIVEGESPEYQVATSPAYIDVIASPDVTINRSLHVYETHGQTLGFIATTQASWLEISGGPFFFTPANLDIGIITDFLEPGFYNDTIFIYPDTDSFSFSPVAVPVYLQVQSDGAVVRAVPDYFHFILAPGDSILNAGMFIYEVSGDSMPYAVELVGQSNWIYFPFDPGSQVTPDSLYFAIFSDGLSPGTYGDSIVIFYPLDDIYGFDDVIVPVELTVHGEPPPYSLEVYPYSFYFYLQPGNIGYDTLFVSETYGREVAFGYHNYAPWLAVNPLGMPPYITPMALPIAASTVNLEPGVYHDTIFVGLVFDSVKSTMIAVPVVMIVHDDPPPYTLEVSPNSFSFHLEPGDIGFDTLFVSEAYDRMAPFGYHNYAPWLAVNPLGMPPYVTPMALPIAASTVNLEPGVYHDTIFVGLVFDSLKSTMLATPVVLTVGGTYLTGDANSDDLIDVGDAVYLINYIFRDGSPPDSFESADANCDDFVNVGDVVHIIAYIFRDGPEPGCP